MNKHISAFVPPIVLSNIQKNGSAAQKVAASHTLAVDLRLRQHRELAPVPTPHVAGEDRNTYTAKNGTSLPGTKVRDELSPIAQDQTVNEAHDGAGDTYLLYYDHFNRKSVDDKNLTLIGTTHYDTNYDNAFWDGNQMVYGDGQFFNPFTRDLTVIGHELTHGVTQYAANLNYQDQSGALNEHISDVFGVLAEQYAYRQTVDKATWLVGALLCEGRIQGRALRDMVNPGTAYDDPIIGKDPQGADMDHYDKTSQDNGGVHINSGIPNRAFALASIERRGNAWETIGKVWYTVLTTRTKPNTQFQEFADSTFVVAGELFGAGSAEQLAIQHGWAKVKITVPAPAPSPKPPPGPPSSPCVSALLGIISDPKTLKQLHTLGRNPLIRKLLAQIYHGARELKENCDE